MLQIADTLWSAMRDYISSYWYTRYGSYISYNYEYEGGLLHRLESIMLQNLLIMLFGISPIFCLLCSFFMLSRYELSMQTKFYKVFVKVHELVMKLHHFSYSIIL